MPGGSAGSVPKPEGEKKQAHLESEGPLAKLVGLMPVRTAGAGCGGVSRVDARQNC